MLGIVTRRVKPAHLKCSAALSLPCRGASFARLSTTTRAPLEKLIAPFGFAGPFRMGTRAKQYESRFERFLRAGGNVVELPPLEASREEADRLNEILAMRMHRDELTNNDVLSTACITVLESGDDERYLRMTGEGANTPPYVDAAWRLPPVSLVDVDDGGGGGADEWLGVATAATVRARVSTAAASFATGFEGAGVTDTSLDIVFVRGVDEIVRHRVDAATAAAAAAATASSGGHDAANARAAVDVVLTAVFAQLERSVDSGEVRAYGVASQQLGLPTAHKYRVSLPRLLRLATDARRQVVVEALSTSTSSLSSVHALRAVRAGVNILEPGVLCERNCTTGANTGDADAMTTFDFATQTGVAVFAERPLDCFGKRGEPVRLQSNQPFEAEEATPSEAATAAAAAAAVDGAPVEVELTHSGVVAAVAEAQAAGAESESTAAATAADDGDGMSRDKWTDPRTGREVAAALSRAMNLGVHMEKDYVEFYAAEAAEGRVTQQRLMHPDEAFSTAQIVASNTAMFHNQVGVITFGSVNHYLPMLSKTHSATHLFLTIPGALGARYACEPVAGAEER
jgi:hypothetical protein